jgi:hypothetical protein
MSDEVALTDQEIIAKLYEGWPGLRLAGAENRRFYEREAIKKARAPKTEVVTKRGLSEAEKAEQQEKAHKAEIERQRKYWDSIPEPTPYRSERQDREWYEKTYT